MINRFNKPIIIRALKWNIDSGVLNGNRNMVGILDNIIGDKEERGGLGWMREEEEWGC